jgi:hypothetical protein
MTYYNGNHDLEGMRELLRTGTLGRSLGTLSAEDRLTAAWLVACGKALAHRGTVISCGDSILKVEVLDSAWLEEFAAVRDHLRRELTRISGVPVRELHFIVKK